MRNHAAFGLLIMAVAALFSSGCNDAGANGEEKLKGGGGRSASDSAPKTMTVTGIPHVESVSLPGASVHGFEMTEIEAKLGGYVRDIERDTEDEEIDIGSIVEKDAVLAVLDIPEMRDELVEKRALITQAQSKAAQADATIRQAEADINRRRAEVDQANARRAEKTAMVALNKAKHTRISRLFSQGSVGEENLDEAKYALESAKAARMSIDAEVATAQAHVVAAQANLTKAGADKLSALASVKVAQAVFARLQTFAKYATITAPFRGVITRRLIDHGDFVRPATSNSAAMPLFEIIRTDMVRVVVSVPNVNAAKIEVGQEIEFHTIGGMPGVKIPGKVTRSAGVLDPKSRMMRIDIHFDNPISRPDSAESIFLKPGLFGTVDVIIKRWENLPVVPTTAVATDDSGQSYVMVVQGDRYKRRPVGIAFNDAQNIGISSGLKPGETVVTTDVKALKDGQEVSGAEK